MAEVYKLKASLDKTLPVYKTLLMALRQQAVLIDSSAYKQLLNTLATLNKLDRLNNDVQSKWLFKKKYIAAYKETLKSLLRVRLPEIQFDITTEKAASLANELITLHNKLNVQVLHIQGLIKTCLREEE